MEANQKWVNLSFLAGAILLAVISFILASRVSAALDFEGRVRDLDLILKGFSFAVGILCFGGFYLNKKANSYMNEVVNELSKVTWPSQEESFKASIAVLIAVTIAGFMLGVIDKIWDLLLKLVM